MIYSFSKELKREWFPAHWYPQAENSPTDAPNFMPDSPRLVFNLGDECIKGFPLAGALNELMAFDAKAFAQPKNFNMEKEINQWAEKERTRLEGVAGFANLFASSDKKGVHNTYALRYNSIEELVYSNQFRTLYERGFTEIKNCSIAKKCFRHNVIPNELTLWILSQLGMFTLDEARAKGREKLEASARIIDQLLSLINELYALPPTLQTAEFFREQCEDKLGIEFNSFSPPDYEKAIISLFEAALGILELDTRLNGHYGLHSSDIELKVWVNARRTDLIQLCAARPWNNRPIVSSYPYKNKELIKEFERFVDVIKKDVFDSESERTLFEKLLWYIQQGISFCHTVNDEIKHWERLQGERRLLERFHKDTTPFSSVARSYNELKISVPHSFEIDAAVASSTIPKNTFKVTCLEELIACMVYAAIDQGYVFHKCPECSLPFIKTIGNNKTYCSDFCQQKHAKEVHRKAAPSPERKNLKKRAKSSPYFRNFFTLLDCVAGRYFGEFQGNSAIDGETYDAWVTALNSFRKGHLVIEGKEIKVVYGKDSNRQPLKIDPFVPMIMDNQLVAVSLKVSAKGSAQKIDDLPETSSEFFDKGCGSGIVKYQKLAVMRRGEKGNVKEELSNLIALGDEKELNRTMDR